MDITRQIVAAYHQSFLAYGSTESGAPLFRSDDFGKTWQGVLRPDSLKSSHAFIAQQYICLANQHGFFRTADSGQHWEKTSNFPIYSEIWFDGKRFIAPFAKNIVASHDFGATWDTLLTNGFIGAVAQQDSLIALFQRSNTNDTLWVSKDDGTTWASEPYTFIGNDPEVSFFHKGKLYAHSFSPAQNTLYRSDDLGKTWMGIKLEGDYFSHSVVIETKRAILTSYEILPLFGIKRSIDGGNSWVESSEGLVANWGSFSIIDHELCAASSAAVYQSDPDRLNWKDLKLPTLIANESPAYYVGYEQAGSNLVTIVYPVNMPPFFSSDAGITWKEAKVDELPSGDDLVYTLEKVGENVIVATNATYQKDLYVSKNDGLSYQRLASLKAQYGQTILDWCQDRGILYALGHDAQLYQSMDIGATWNPIGTILLKDSFGISFSKDYNLHFFIRDSSVFYFNRRGLITSEKWGMLVSNDLGTHWQFYDLKTALLPWGNNPFLYLVSVGASLIAASPVGVFRSDDKGQSWYNWSEGLGKRKVIEFQVYDGYLWAAVQSNGIWKRPLGSVSANEVSFRNTTSWALFPNPLAPGQSLTILTQTEGAYRVRLFDATGKVVVEKNLEGTTRLDNLNLPSGVYGYEILSDAQRVTGKLVVGR